MGTHTHTYLHRGLHARVHTRSTHMQVCMRGQGDTATQAQADMHACLITHTHVSTCSTTCTHITI